jgi:hypothetical protein
MGKKNLKEHIRKSADKIDVIEKTNSRSRMSSLIETSSFVVEEQDAKEEEE